MGEGEETQSLDYRDTPHGPTARRFTFTQTDQQPTLTQRGVLFHSSQSPPPSPSTTAAEWYALHNTCQILSCDAAAWEDVSWGMHTI